MRRILTILVLALGGCGTNEENTLPPPKLPAARIDLPDGAALRPFDSARPTRSFPQGLVMGPAGKFYASLANLRLTTPCPWSECYEPGGPGLLAEIDASAKSVELVDLGAGCTNPGSLVVRSGRVYVSCTADYVNGALAIFDPASRALTTLPLGGSPGALAVAADGTVYVANTVFAGAVDCGDDGFTDYLTAGSVDVVSWEGQVLHSGMSSPRVVCPASCDAQWNGVGDVRVVGGDLFVACFGSDELRRLDRIDLRERSVRVVGDGPVALAPAWGARMLVANTLGESLSVVSMGADGSMSVDHDKVSLGVSPNDVEVRGDFAYVVNSGTATVQKIALATMSVADSRTTLDRSNPFSLAFEDDDVVWVTAYTLGAVLKIDFRE